MVELENILIVKLYKAIEKNNPDIIEPGLSKYDFEELVENYIDMQIGDRNLVEERVLRLETKIKIATASLYVLSTNIMDQDMMDVLNSLNFKITKDNYPYDLIEINKQLDRLKAKLERLKKDLPKEKKKKDKKSTIYEILASMSANLEGVYLDPRKITVAEFISYQKVLEERKESYEKIKRKT